ncbi:DNA adenine methylase [Pinibacter soli]|uniref:site-specific DNA-methyltransferase (adenine-specific) n=1 Tax=Pinibacter soli TaxID=3044211 RepID=A0ABT6RAF1_9BACT|nr:DNA adenine methylase [Pinibacter soli]MDI3319498.1 DNA adenine methylase [Pinibacter soli]
MEFYSPLRYPGGKGKISNFIKLIFEKNLLVDGYYVEPYAGGASVALSLLFDEYASNIIINDIDRSVFAFWYSVLNNTEEFCDLILKTNITTKVWKRQKEIQKQKDSTNLLELGFSTFFLNRTNRSGIIKAGVIGGNAQDGNYKIDARFNKEELIRRIRRIAAYKERIELFNLDAIELITTISNYLPEKTLIYFDPPYYVKGKDLYVNHYKHEDHVLVSEMVNGITEHKWIVSYDNAPEINKIYKRNKKFEYTLNYSAVNATSGTEVMVHHNDLYIPSFNPIF